MEMETALAKKLDEKLNPTEKRAYLEYVSKQKPPLSPKTSAELFNLFLNQASCEEIARLNPGMGLGAIVRARVDLNWDEKREVYLEMLHDSTKLKAGKTQLEAIDFATNFMSVYHKMFNDKFKKYLQTGNPEDLGDFEHMSFKQYKDNVEMLLKLTGQDTQQRVSGTITHKVVDSQVDTVRTISPQEAAEILKTIDGEFKKE